MAAGYHVFSAAQLETSTGTSNAYEEVGFTVKGIEIRQNPKIRRIMTDVGGSEVPAEKQQMLETWDITGRLVVYDSTVLAKLCTRNDNTTPTEGVFGTAGLLIGTGGYTFKVGVLPAGSQTSELPYYFAFANMIEPKVVTVGTINMEYDIHLEAWGFLAGTLVTSKGLVVMSRTVI